MPGTEPANGARPRTAGRSIPVSLLPCSRRFCPASRSLLLWAAICLAGCSSPPPTAEEAARALLASEPFRTARFEVLPETTPARCADSLAGQPAWSRWIGLGLASASEVVTAAGPVCRLTVDEAVRREADNWIHRVPSAGKGNEAALALPVAVRSLLRVSEIRTAGRGVAEASFEWQWRLNTAGQRLGIDTSPRTGWAQLVLDDSGWRTSRVEPGAN